MAIRLSLRRDPDWVDIGSGAALFCVPPTAFLVHAARAQATALIVELKSAGEAVTKAGGRIAGVPDLSVEQNAQGLFNALFTVSAAEIAVTDWRGVEGRRGEPLKFEPALLARLFESANVSDRFRANYFRPLDEVTDEGEG
jgi:hypothetical protein